MIRVVKAELLKIFTARSSLVLCLLALGLSYLLALLAGLLSDYSDVASPGEDLASSGQLTLFFVLILGVLAIGSEYRHGSIAPTLLVTPSRVRLFLGKLLAVLIVALGIGVGAVAGCALIGVVVLPAQGAEFGSSTSEILSLLLETAALAPIYAAVGFGVCAILRNQTGAIVLILVWMFVVEVIVGGLLSAYAPYTLGEALSAAAQDDTGTQDALSRAGGFLVSGGYAVVLLIGGLLITERSDVTG